MNFTAVTIMTVSEAHDIQTYGELEVQNINTTTSSSSTLSSIAAYCGMYVALHMLL